MTATCFLHPAIAATASCEDCRAALCGDCSQTALGRTWCAACLSARVGASPPPTPLAPPPPFGGAAYGVSARLKSRFAAGLLSGLVPGLGNVYTGYVVRGVAQFAAWWLVFAVARGSLPGFIIDVLAAFGTIGLWIWGIVDAVRRAGAINRRGYLATPEETRSISLGPVSEEQLRFVGVGLVAIGVLLFAQEIGGVFLDIFRFALPLGLIGLGAWIVRRAQAKDERQRGGTFDAEEMQA